jgi:hypothetical protein
MPAAGCPGLQVVNPICQAGSVVSQAATAGARGIFDAMAKWVADAASWLVGQIGDAVGSTTSIDLTAGWFESHYRVMLTLLGVVVLPLLLGSVVQSILRQDSGPLVRSVLVHLPLSMVLAGGAVKLVQLALAATDALSATVSSGSGTDLHDVMGGVGSGITGALATPSIPAFVVLFVALLVVIGALALWIELLLRAAAVYVAVLFLPLALASVVWPAISHWCRRLVDTLAALILSKLVIVAVLSLAAGALAAGTGNAGANAGAAGGVQAVLAGAALLLLAAFSPYTLLRLIPMVESGAVGQLEGLRHRAQRFATSVPYSAAAFALREAGLAALDPGVPGTGRATPMEAPGGDWTVDDRDGGYDGDYGSQGGSGSDALTSDLDVEEEQGAGGGAGPSGHRPPDPYQSGAQGGWDGSGDSGDSIPMWKGNRAVMEVYERALAAAQARSNAAQAALGPGPRKPTRLDGPGKHVLGRDSIGPVIQWIPPDTSQLDDEVDPSGFGIDDDSPWPLDPNDL